MGGGRREIGVWGRKLRNSKVKLLWVGWWVVLGCEMIIRTRTTLSIYIKI